MTTSARERLLTMRCSALLALPVLVVQWACSDPSSSGYGGESGDVGPSGVSSTGQSGSASSGASTEATGTSTTGQSGSGGSAGTVDGSTSGGASTSSSVGGMSSTSSAAGATGAGGALSTGFGGSSPGVAGSPASGAGGSSAGGGGGVAGSGGGSPGSGCAGKDYALCEDFENGEVGSIPTGWTPFKGYGDGSPTDVVLATDDVHGGAMSLKSQSQQRGATRAQRGLADLGETAYRHWGRIFYKVDYPSPNPSGYFHATFVSLIGPNNEENRIVDSVEAPNGTHQWLFNVPDDSCCTGSSYDWEFDDQWHCAEWYVDATEHSFQFFHDSTEVQQIGFTGRNDAPMSEYATIVVGETYYQNSDIISEPFTIWFDDLAIDADRIGCE